MTEHGELSTEPQAMLINHPQIVEAFQLVDEVPSNHTRDGVSLDIGAAEEAQLRREWATEELVAAVEKDHGDSAIAALSEIVKNNSAVGFGVLMNVLRRTSEGAQSRQGILDLAQKLLDSDAKLPTHERVFTDDDRLNLLDAATKFDDSEAKVAVAAKNEVVHGEAEVVEAKQAPVEQVERTDASAKELTELSRNASAAASNGQFNSAERYMAKITDEAFYLEVRAHVDSIFAKHAAAAASNGHYRSAEDILRRIETEPVLAEARRRVDIVCGDHAVKKMTEGFYSSAEQLMAGMHNEDIQMSYRTQLDNIYGNHAEKKAASGYYKSCEDLYECIQSPEARQLFRDRLDNIYGSHAENKAASGHYKSCEELFDSIVGQGAIQLYRVRIDTIYASHAKNHLSSGRSTSARQLFDRIQTPTIKEELRTHFN